MPLSFLPSYFLTTTLTSSVTCEDFGKWFQFEVSFDISGSSEASAVVPIIKFGSGKLSQSISALADGNISVTINTDSIAEIYSNTKHTVVSILGLKSNNFPTTVKRQATILSPMTSAIRVDKVLVANVGQGSMNVFYQNSTIKVVYDFGFGSGVGHMTEQEELELINKINADSPVMVLSHWDLDHFKYLSKYPSLIQMKPFVVPSFGAELGNAAKQHISSKIVIQPYNLAGLHLGNVKLGVTLGTFQGFSKNNYGALTVCIFDNINNPLFLFPGDASYDTITSVYKSNLLFLVATHHGSSNRIGTIPTARNNQGTAIFSYGQGNHYGHSVTNVETAYRNKGWQTLKATPNSGQGIVEILTPHL